jgi:hypothetical protein
VIWHHGELWLWEGFTEIEYTHPTTGLRAVRVCKPGGRYPGYGRLRNFLTDEVRNLRLDTIML